MSLSKALEVGTTACGREARSQRVSGTVGPGALLPYRVPTGKGSELARSPSRPAMTALCGRALRRGQRRITRQEGALDPEKRPGRIKIVETQRSPKRALHQTQALIAAGQKPKASRRLLAFSKPPR